MIHRISRRAIACALLAGTSLLGLSASPAAAEQYQPQKFRAVDANGVDLTWGDFIMNFVEGSIGSGDAKLELVREAPYRPGSYDSNSNNLTGTVSGSATARRATPSSSARDLRSSR